MSQFSCELPGGDTPPPHEGDTAIDARDRVRVHKTIAVPYVYSDTGTLQIPFTTWYLSI